MHEVQGLLSNAYVLQLSGARGLAPLLGVELEVMKLSKRMGPASRGNTSFSVIRFAHRSMGRGEFNI
jgi:hypothetical protein